MQQKKKNTTPEKKILIDLLNLATPQIAGVGVFTRNLIHYWFQKDLSYRIVCYSSYNIDAEKLFGFKASDRIQLRTIKVKHVIARLLYQQVILPFHLKGYNIYFNPAVGLPFLARLLFPEVKLVMTIHDMTPFFLAKKYSFLRTFLVKILSKNAAKTAHKVITVSQNSNYLQFYPSSL
jgi:hypothetical protein